MSLRQKYLKILSEIMPAGAVGISLLLGSTAPGDANQRPIDSQPAASDLSSVSDGSPPFAMRSPMLPGPSPTRGKANSSLPGAIGGATAGGGMADGEIGAMGGAMAVGTIGGIIGEAIRGAGSASAASQV